MASPHQPWPRTLLATFNLLAMASNLVVMAPNLKLTNSFSGIPSVLRFHHCPEILIIQLKRFEWNGGLLPKYLFGSNIQTRMTFRWQRRLNHPVRFPLGDLDFTPYCTASSKITALDDLAAVSKHTGSPALGSAADTDTKKEREKKQRRKEPDGTCKPECKRVLKNKRPNSF